MASRPYGMPVPHIAWAVMPYALCQYRASHSTSVGRCGCLPILCPCGRSFLACTCIAYVSTAHRIAVALDS
eukprot:3937936-Rhodomonas_salina.1